MVDQVIDYQPDDFIITKKCISSSDFFIQGHFPTQSIYPGVLLLEGFQQSCEILMGLKRKEQFNLADVSLRLKSMVVPGDLVLFHVTADVATDAFTFICSGMREDLEVVSAILRYEPKEKE